jgi:hypothetical protein
MSRIASILALTEEIETLISDGRWTDAAQCEARRRDLLVEYVEAEGRGAPGLRELYERSLQSMADIRRQRNTLTGDASQLIRNSRAVDAYLGQAGADKGNR